MQEVDAFLTAVLVAEPEDGESAEQYLTRIKSQIKEKILESYRNGQKSREKPRHFRRG
jgi:hypothetical protein